MNKFKRNLYLILIFILAIFLRLNYDIFISGYNYDEIAIMSTAVQNFPLEILKTAATNDYHAPLYQLIVHFFTYLPNEWVWIRLFNLILSLINIFVFYKIGSLFKNKLFGLIFALMLAVNHIVISTVSFVKFYCLLFLLTSISFYYFIKILNKNNSYIKFAITNIFLILTGTHAFIFVFLEYIFLFFVKKNNIDKVTKSAITAFIGFLLYFPILLKQIILNFTNILSPHGSYAGFSFASIYNIFNDYFSPLLNYCCNLTTLSSFGAIVTFINSLKETNIKYDFLFVFIIFSLLPVTIGVYFIIKAVIKNYTAKIIALNSITYFLICILITLLNITGMISIYLYAFGISILILFAVGICENIQKKSTLILFSIYLFVNLFITNCYPPQLRGVRNAKSFYCLEKYLNEHPDIYLIATNGGRFVKKYYKNKKIFDFSEEKMRGNFQKDYIGLIYGQDTAKKINRYNAYEIMLPLLKEKKRDIEFEKYFKKNVYEKLNKNDKLVLSFYNEEDNFLVLNINDLDKKPYCPKQFNLTIKNVVKNNYNCIDTAVLSHAIGYNSYNYLFDLLDKYFKREKIEQYIRLNNDKYFKQFESTKIEYSTLWLSQYTTNSWIFITYSKE